MSEHFKLRLMTVVIVFAGCAVAFALWRANALILAGIAFFGAEAAEIVFGIRGRQRARQARSAARLPRA